jgi:hypothetical protein
LVVIWAWASACWMPKTVAESRQAGMIADNGQGQENRRFIPNVIRQAALTQ